MSHYARLSIQAQQKFEAELVASLQEHFGTNGVEVHEQKADLLTYMKEKSGLKANIIVRQATQGKKFGGRMLAVNDLGYERNTKGTYDLHVDEDGFNSEAQSAVIMSYAEKVAKKQMLTRGYGVAKRATLPTGEVQLTLQRYG
jgi:Protein of unknown function (DUF1257)